MALHHDDLKEGDSYIKTHTSQTWQIFYIQGYQGSELDENWFYKSAHVIFPLPPYKLENLISIAYSFGPN